MRLGFRAKVLLAITLISIGTSLSIGVLYFNRTKKEIETNYIQALWDTMSISIHSLERNMQQAYNTVVALSYDDQLISMINQYRGEELEDALQISAYLRAEMQGVDNVKNTYCYLPELACTVTSEDYHAVEQTPPGSHLWLTGTQTGGGLSPQLVYDGISRTPVYTLSYCSRMAGGEANTPLLCVNMDERRLFYQYLDEMDTNGVTAYYLINAEGSVLSASNQQDIGRPLSAAIHIKQDLSGLTQDTSLIEDGQDRLIAAVRSPFSGFSLVAVSNRHVLTASLQQQRNFIFGFLGVAILIMLIPAYHMAGQVYEPVRQLQDAMKKVSDGDLSARAPIWTKDEIGQLSGGFNRMVEEIQHLIRDLVNEQMQKKEAELEALQYQITPHFMYNTLNSIKYAAILQGNQEVGEQLDAFIQLLQASIRRNGAFISVQNEVHMVQNYIKLQQFRYGDSFTVSYDLSAEAEQCYVPRLILQPLVENAILHGQNSSDAYNHITISTACANDTVVLAVQDAGDGMNQEQLAALMQGKKAHKGGFSGIGIPNIIERLKLYYGINASLQFTSSEHGTKAVILLPFSTNPEEYTI